MMAALAPRRPLNLFRDVLLPAPTGRHRRVRLPISKRLAAMILGYAGVWALFSSYATVALAR